MPVKVYDASIRLEDASQHPQQGGLAGAVAAYQPHDLPLVDGEGDPVEGFKVLYPFALLAVLLLLPTSHRHDAAIAQVDVSGGDGGGLAGGGGGFGFRF